MGYPPASGLYVPNVPPVMGSPSATDYEQQMARRSRPAAIPIKAPPGKILISPRSDW